MAKRTYGEGTKRCRSGTWEIGYRTHRGGKQIWEKVGRESEGVDEAAAELVLKERLVSIGRGEGASFEGWSFPETAHDWLKRYRALDTVVERTIELAEITVRCHLVPAFQDVLLHEFDIDLVEDYMIAKTSKAPGTPGAMAVEGKAAKARTQPLSRATVQKQLTVLSQICKFAIRKKRMTQDPVPLVEWRGKQKGRKGRTARPEPLEREQVLAILLNARDEEEELQFLLMASLGLRLGELLGAYAHDYIDRKKTLHICRTQTKVGGQTLITDYGEAKTDAGNRQLKLSDGLHRRMMRQLARVNALPSPAGMNRLLFPNTVGRIQSEANFRNRIWHETLDRAGLLPKPGEPAMNPHRLRHTAASEMIAKGVLDTVIAYRLGHANAQITRTFYAHIFARHRDEVADLAEIYRHDKADDTPIGDGESEDPASLLYG